VVVNFTKKKKVKPISPSGSHICPKTGMVESSHKRLNRFFLFFGFSSLAWFLIRVIPKPSRASYPCMKVAAPLASGFIAYIAGLAAVVAAFRKARRQWGQARHVLAALCIMTGLLAGAWTITRMDKPAGAEISADPFPANTPVGTPVGIFPGRVVWIYDPNATNDNCDPVKYGHGWFMNENNDQPSIDKMVTGALQSISGQSSPAAAWEAIFKFHNDTRGKGKVGYKAGEKIMIKTNCTSSWGGNISTKDLSIVQNSSYGISETSPQLVLSVLRQLVKVAGVAEKDITVGDPIRHVYKHCYDLWHAEFPDMNYLDHDYGAEKSRVLAVASSSPQIFYSDRGSVLGSTVLNDKLYTVYTDAEYLINLPTLKGHGFAGVTMFAKNHFGSHTRGDASHLHKGLVATLNKGQANRKGYGLYRVQVDLMGHTLLGQKNLVYLLDALWTSDNEIDAPDRWQMAPFNDGWSSSIFISLDPVAIESVGYDFLKNEFTGANGKSSFPQMEGADDYLHQAASSAVWPAGIVYDPDNDGKPISSLGVHEHWNNAKDKNYTRNLGTGTGIELVKLIPGTPVEAQAPATSLVRAFTLSQNHPNPFNGATSIRYGLTVPAFIELEVYSIDGRKIRTLVRGERSAGTYAAIWDGMDEAGMPAASGVYVCRLQAKDGAAKFADSRTMLLTK
jgi:hypothetical protein